MVESRRVLGKGRIRASIQKLYRRIPEKGQISVSTKKWSNLGKYREKVESVRVLGKGRIRASIEKLSWRLSKKGRINVSTEK